MLDIHRRVVRHDDATTSGGRVIAPGSNNAVADRQIAKAGDQVWCPACKSHGVIVSVPPMPESFHHGVRLAFDGDLCACACLKPPRLISSVTHWSASNFKAPGLLDPAAAGWLLFAGHEPASHGLGFDQIVKVNDPEGRPLAGVPYRITMEPGHVFVGVTDAEGCTERIYSHQSQSAHLEVPYYGDTDDSIDPGEKYVTCHYDDGR